MKVELGGLPALMFLVFVTLKLTHYIAWSWLWVTAPLWMGVALVGLVVGIAILALVAHSLYDWAKSRRRKAARG